MDGLHGEKKWKDSRIMNTSLGWVLMVSASFTKTGNAGKKKKQQPRLK